MMKIALVVGVNYYEHGSLMYGCVNDAYSVKTILGRNDGGSVNFDSKLLTASGPADAISRATLKDSIARLFSERAEIALFYFSGHGHIESTGGYLLTSESSRGDDGVALS